MMKVNDKIHMKMIMMMIENIDQGAEMDNMDNQYLIFIKMILIRVEEIEMMKFTMLIQLCTHLEIKKEKDLKI